jgi:NADH:ubiquinone oxidoreductase subunit 3 (subunit A)
MNAPSTSRPKTLKENTSFYYSMVEMKKYFVEKYKIGGEIRHEIDSKYNVAALLMRVFDPKKVLLFDIQPLASAKEWFYYLAARIFLLRWSCIAYHFFRLRRRMRNRSLFVLQPPTATH